MNAVNEIKKILGDNLPAHFKYAKENGAGVTIPARLTRSKGWNQFYEERNLSRDLQPLTDKGWSIETGPVNFRTGTPSELHLIPPRTDGINTATLPLRDRVRVEAKMKAGTSAGSIVDALEINEEAQTVTFDSTGAPAFPQRQIAEMVDDLRSAGWTGPIGNRFGKSGIYGTLTAPDEGVNVTRVRIDAYLPAPAKHDRDSA